MIIPNFFENVKSGNGDFVESLELTYFISQNCRLGGINRLLSIPNSGRGNRRNDRTGRRTGRQSRDQMRGSKH